MRKLLFAVVLLAGLFIGCGQKVENEVKVDSTQVDTTSVMADTTSNVDSTSVDSASVK